MMGVAKFLVNKEAFLKMDFDEPRETFLLKGNLTNAELVEGRKELISLDLQYDENMVPMGYKIRVNDYLSQIRPDGRGSENLVEKKPVPPKKQTPATQATPTAAKPAAPGQQAPTEQPAAVQPSAAKQPEAEWPSPNEIANTAEAPVNKVIDSKSPS